MTPRASKTPRVPMRPRALTRPRTPVTPRAPKAPRAPMRPRVPKTPRAPVRPRVLCPVLLTGPGPPGVDTATRALAPGHLCQREYIQPGSRRPSQTQGTPAGGPGGHHPGSCLPWPVSGSESWSPGQTVGADSLWAARPQARAPGLEPASEKVSGAQGPTPHSPHLGPSEQAHRCPLCTPGWAGCRPARAVAHLRPVSQVRCWASETPKVTDGGQSHATGTSRQGQATLGGIRRGRQGRSQRRTRSLPGALVRAGPLRAACWMLRPP